MPIFIVTNLPTYALVLQSFGACLPVGRGRLMLPAYALVSQSFGGQAKITNARNDREARQCLLFIDVKIFL
ncbi:TPA: hypothetical protein DF272_03235 [Candidatus Falkowbacteria bacterium]|nr:hypothetical protein [Candidatus Falkowbacteria bacterium]